MSKHLMPLGYEQDSDSLVIKRFEYVTINQITLLK